MCHRITRVLHAHFRRRRECPEAAAARCACCLGTSYVCVCVCVCTLSSLFSLSLLRLACSPPKRSMPPTRMLLGVGLLVSLIGNAAGADCSSLQKECWTHEEDLWKATQLLGGKWISEIYDIFNNPTTAPVRVEMRNEFLDQQRDLCRISKRGPPAWATTQPHFDQAGWWVVVQ